METQLQELLITREYFKEITEIELDEIKHGITYEDIKNLTKEDLKEIRKSFDFESAISKARIEKGRNLPLGSIISNLSFHVLFAIVFFVLLIQLLLLIIDFTFNTNMLSYKIPVIAVPIYYTAIPLGFWMGIELAKESSTKSKEERIKKADRLESLVRLRKLFIECENFNKVIQSINVKDQINNVLEYSNDPTREEIIVALKKIRSNLIKALKIDKVLRENADVVNIDRESLEITFAELQYTDITKRASQYSEFVEQVLTIGVSLNQEFEMLSTSKIDDEARLFST